MYHTLSSLWIELLRKGLAEDGQPWDWTSLGLKSPRGHSEAHVLAKSDGVWAAQTLTECLPEVFSRVQVESFLSDGSTFKKGESLVRFKGPIGTLLALERPFLNLAAYVSGIASMTQAMVNQVKRAGLDRPPRVTLTRKTLPGYRDIAVHGVRVGGGFPHRVSLSGGVLIKENHVAAAGNIEAAVRAARSAAPHGLKIELEVRDRGELDQAILSRVDGVLLDNFSSEQVREAVEVIRAQGNGMFIEVSGGITLKTIADYAISGVDVLSVGALTHSASSVDLSFLVDG